jgi:hypothetical protein
MRATFESNTVITHIDAHVRAHEVYAEGDDVARRLNVSDVVDKEVRAADIAEEERIGWELTDDGAREWSAAPAVPHAMRMEPGEERALAERTPDKVDPPVEALGDRRALECVPMQIDEEDGAVVSPWRKLDR